MTTPDTAWKLALRDLRHAALDAGLDNFTAETLSNAVEREVVARVATAEAEATALRARLMPKIHPHHIKALRAISTGATGVWFPSSTINALRKNGLIEKRVLRKGVVGEQKTVNVVTDAGRDALAREIERS